MSAIDPIKSSIDTDNAARSAAEHADSVVDAAHHATVSVAAEHANDAMQKKPRRRRRKNGEPREVVPAPIERTQAERDAEAAEDDAMFLIAHEGVWED